MKSRCDKRMLCGISYLDNPDSSFRTKSLLARQKRRRSRRNHYYRRHRHLHHLARFRSHVSLQAAPAVLEEERPCLSK